MISVDDLLASVAVEVGLDDYGDPTFRDGLDALWISATTEADLNEIGMLALEGMVRGNLANRLRVHAWHRAHPRSPTRRSKRPSSSWGCLAAAPLRSATCSPPIPTTVRCSRGRPTSRSRRRPPRPITTTRASSRRSAPSAVDLVNPDFKAIHHDEPDDAMECTVLHAQHFQSLIYPTLFNVPGYDEWSLSAGWVGAARYHRLVLQVLQSECPGRWQLKSPQYGLLLDELFDTYPDARLVVTHRDPVKIAASTFSLLRSLTGTFSDVDHTDYIVSHWPDTLSALIDRAMDSRDRIGEDAFFDVAYADVVRDPVAVVGTIYERFGIEWNAEKEAYFRRFHAANPQHKYGTHRYSLAEVGVERAPLDARFARYYERYDVPREEA